MLFTGEKVDGSIVTEPVNIPGELFIPAYKGDVDQVGVEPIVKPDDIEIIFRQKGGDLGGTILVR